MMVLRQTDLLKSTRRSEIYWLREFPLSAVAKALFSLNRNSSPTVVFEHRRSSAIIGDAARQWSAMNYDLVKTRLDCSE